MYGGVYNFRSNHKITSIGDPELSRQTYWKEFDIHPRRYCFECFFGIFHSKPIVSGLSKNNEKNEWDENAETLFKIKKIPIDNHMSDHDSLSGWRPN